MAAGRGSSQISGHAMSKDGEDNNKENKEDSLEQVHKSPSPSSASTPRKDDLQEKREEKPEAKEEKDKEPAVLVVTPRVEDEKGAKLDKDDPLHKMEWLSCEQAAVTSVEEVINVLKVGQKKITSALFMERSTLRVKVRRPRRIDFS